MQRNTKKTKIYFRIYLRFCDGKIELEFDSKLISTEQVLKKISQVVKYAKDQGLHLRELGLEAEVHDKEEED